jgi:hypothetical protein
MNEITRADNPATGTVRFQACYFDHETYSPLLEALDADTASPVVTEFAKEWSPQMQAQIAVIEAELERFMDLHGDDDEIEAYLEKFLTAAKKRWQRKAEQRLAAATAEMNRNISASERQHFASRGLLRGRHKR